MKAGVASGKRLWPLVVLQSPENILLISNLGSSYAPDFGVAALPAALIFFIMQKHFVAGMLGSVK